MGVTTWLDRITDETNLWLSAVKAEEGNDLQGAAAMYLEDSASCLEKGSQVRSALGCACAADCLTKSEADEQGKRLYLEAGVMYSDVAEAKLSGSIREALWAFRRAYECFVLAEDVKESEAARESFQHLAKRANPFAFGTDGFDLPQVRPPKPRPKGWVPVQPEGPVRASMDRFLALRPKVRARTQVETPKFLPRRPEVDFAAQEGIVSQLG